MQDKYLGSFDLSGREGKALLVDLTAMPQALCPMSSRNSAVVYLPHHVRASSGFPSAPDCLVLILFGLDCVVGQDTRGKAEACTA